ncbi:MAG TPA: hypothetical protein VMH86_15810 [Rhizomicrobium sp.]|nr:hypothetical protein [Rhizomicrobium sp.]
MTDTTGVAGRESFRGTAVIAYLLYLIGWPCLHLTTVIGLILAYVQRGESRGTIWESHFSNLIEVFWLGLLLGIVGAILIPVFGVGIPVLVIVFVWMLYRTIRGLVRAIDGRPY